MIMGILNEISTRDLYRAIFYPVEEEIIKKIQEVLIMSSSRYGKKQQKTVIIPIAMIVNDVINARYTKPESVWFYKWIEKVIIKYEYLLNYQVLVTTNNLGETIKLLNQDNNNKSCF